MSSFSNFLWFSNSMIVAALMILLPLAAVVWFICSLVSYLKTPKGYRRSRRSILILSALFALVLGGFLCYLRPKPEIVFEALIHTLPLAAAVCFAATLARLLKTPKERRRPLWKWLILSATAVLVSSAILYCLYFI